MCYRQRRRTVAYSCSMSSPRKLGPHGEGLALVRLSLDAGSKWVPAFAGMTPSLEPVWVPIESQLSILLFGYVFTVGVSVGACSDASSRLWLSAAG